MLPSWERPRVWPASWLPASARFLALLPSELGNTQAGLRTSPLVTESNVPTQARPPQPPHRDDCIAAPEVKATRVPYDVSPELERNRPPAAGSSVVTSTSKGAKSSAIRAQTSMTTERSASEKAAEPSVDQPGKSSVLRPLASQKLVDSSEPPSKSR